MLLSSIRPGRAMLWILFIAAILLSTFVSFVGLRSGLIFGFDQARDAFEAYAIWHNHDLKILGPSSDIPGVHHGVLWYYFLAVIYFITQGDPNIASMLFFIIFLATVPLGAWVVHKIFKNQTITIIFTLLYINAPLFQMFNRWLSNPTLALIISPLLLYCVYRYIQVKERKYLFFTGLELGLLIHADFAFGIFFLTLLVYCIYYRLKFSLKDIAIFFLGLCIVASTFFIAEIKFQGKTIQGLMAFISNGATSKEAMESLFGLLNKVTDALAFTVFPFPKLFILILFVVALWKYPYKKNKHDPFVFLLLWLSNLVFFQIFSSGFVNSSFMLAPSLFPLIATVSYLLVFYVKNVKFLFLVVAGIYIMQLSLSMTWIKNYYMPLSVQQGMTLDEEEKLIGYTYLSSQKKPFTIKTLTNPLYINTLWAYLYEQTGEKKYGYVPFLDGRSQKGYLGNLPERNFDTNIRYLIIEPLEGIQPIYVTKIVYEEDRVSDIVEVKKFGKFIVQKRILHKNKGPIPIPQILLNNKTILEE